MARRYIENAHAKKDGKLCLLALDWAKAFDSIMSHTMIHALKRFGLPNDFLHMIEVIYSSRSFSVHDTNMDSTTKSQHAIKVLFHFQYLLRLMKRLQALSWQKQSVSHLLIMALSTFLFVHLFHIELKLPYYRYQEQNN